MSKAFRSLSLKHNLSFLETSLMHFKLFAGWLLLAPLVSSSLADYTEQEVLIPGGAPPDTLEDAYIGKPHHPHYEVPPADSSAGTVYEVLANDERFTLITKAINFVDDIAALLNDSSTTLTFFAPPDKVLRRPHGSPRNITLPEGLNTFGDDNLVTLVSQYRDLVDLVPVLEDLDNSDLSQAATDDDDRDDKEKRKKIFKIILRAILSYHILPDGYDIAELTKNATYPTKLQIHDVLDGEPLRLRVSRNVLPPSVHINFYARVLHPDVKASNGIIHVVNHALLPPPSIFQELYWFPSAFSTFTSALQRSNLTGDIDLRFVRGRGLVGTSLATVFAPTNRAFSSLPKKLQLFLFSPLGERVLKKLLQYHIVPNSLIHSNYIHGDVAPDALDTGDQEFDHPTHQSHAKPKLPHATPVFSLNLTADTLFENHTVNAHIVQRELSFPSIPGHKKPTIIDTKVFVNGRPAVLTDVPSLNGAIHVVSKILDPRKHHHGHHRKHHHHHHRKHDEHEHSVYRAHHHGLALFGRLNGVDDLESAPASCPCAKGKHGQNDHHVGNPPRVAESSGEGFGCPHHAVSLGEIHHKHGDVKDGKHDPWADWEDWLPQWAEQD